MLANTRKLSKVNADDYAAIFLVGGQGPMYTYRGNADVDRVGSLWFALVFGQGMGRNLAFKVLTC